MDYQKIYNKDYFSGKTSFFYKLGYGNFQKFYFDNLFNPLKPYINKITSGKVLDVGCAYGFMLERMPDSFEKFGVDVSEYAISIAKKRLPSAVFVISDAEKSLPFQEETFDVVICNDVLEHLENPAMALENIKKVLKKGGILYINTPNLNSFRKKILGFADKKEHHISMFSHKNLLDLLGTGGFKVEKHWTYVNFTYFFFIKFNSNIGTESAYVCVK
jgi:2-polyprenyl-3-methyl-5-hydroxy-6-metoxy-1,4-benzoquinol methylase